MKKFLMKQSAPRIIALGFLTVILIGSGLLMLPVCIQPGQSVRYVDALYTSTSAVCVTGLLTMDSGVAFTPIGRFIIGALIQIGGLGVTTVGAGVILAMGRKINLKGRNLIQEAGNLENGKGAIRFVIAVLKTTLTIELIGAALSFLVFIRNYPPLEALGYSLFHAVTAFNNAGIDILGTSGDLHSNCSLLAYHDNLLLNIVTMLLIIFGGIGFLVIQEMRKYRLNWKKYSMHAKVVLTMSLALTIIGTLLIKLTEADESWLGALFHSVSTRTAGFSTTDLSTYSDAGLLGMMVLMLIGASPGSTGGGIKTTTFFVLMKGIYAAATNEPEKAFKYSIPKNLFRKSAVIILLAIGVVIVSTYFLLILDPQIAFLDAFFEMLSAFATVGLSTGITSSLSTASKLLSIVIMFIGRLGPLTIASLWYFSNGERFSYPEGNISIG